MRFTRVVRTCVVASTFFITLGPSVGRAFEGVMLQRSASFKLARLGKALKQDFRADRQALLAWSVEDLFNRARTNGKLVEARVLVKGEKVRIESKEHSRDSEYAIWNLDSGLVLFVDPRERRVTEWTKASFEAMQEESRASNPEPHPPEMQRLLPDPPTPTFKSLDRTQTIAGLSASAYEFTTYGQRRERPRVGERVSNTLVTYTRDVTIAWITTTHPTLARTTKRMYERGEVTTPPSFAQPDPQKLFFEQGLPVRVQRLTQHDYSIDDIAGIVAQPVSDEVFVPPTGYSTVPYEVPPLPPLPPLEGGLAD